MCEAADEFEAFTCRELKRKVEFRRNPETGAQQPFDPQTKAPVTIAYRPHGRGAYCVRWEGECWGDGSNIG